MLLSENFSLAEAEKSQQALRHNIDNSVSLDMLPRVKFIALEILQPVRNHFGIPFSPSSWWRGKLLNDLIGGSYGSQHCKAEAVDFEVPGVSNKTVAEWIIAHLKFDQLILEYWRKGVPNAGWLHCSKVINGTNRGEVLRYDGANYLIGLD